GAVEAQAVDGGHEEVEEDGADPTPRRPSRVGAGELEPGAVLALARHGALGLSRPARAEPRIEAEHLGDHAAEAPGRELGIAPNAPVAPRRGENEHVLAGRALPARGRRDHAFNI